ncbi:protein transport protein Sec16A-like [Sycon ciliatum]|uniref:protein transport protein Sec16A-like n=1 Tax=Sycon ciliatum TaxID=27933 RepID=UPI0031F5F986
MDFPGSAQPPATDGVSAQPPVTGDVSTQPVPMPSGFFTSTQPSAMASGFFTSTQPSAMPSDFFASTQPSAMQSELFTSTQPSTQPSGFFTSAQPSAMPSGLFTSAQPPAMPSGFVTQPSAMSVSAVTGPAMSTTIAAAPTMQTTAAPPPLQTTAAPPPLQTTAASPMQATTAAPAAMQATAAAPPMQTTAAAPPPMQTTAAPPMQTTTAVPESALPEPVVTVPAVPATAAMPSLAMAATAAEAPTFPTTAVMEPAMPRTGAAPSAMLTTAVMEPAMPRTGAAPSAMPTTAVMEPAMPRTGATPPAMPTTAMMAPAMPTTAMMEPATPTTAAAPPTFPTAAMMEPGMPTTAMMEPAMPTTAMMEPTTTAAPPTFPTAAMVEPAMPTTTAAPPAMPTTAAATPLIPTTAAAMPATAVMEPAMPTTVAATPSMPTIAQTVPPPATAAHVMQPPATAAHVMQPPATAAHAMQPPATAAHDMQPPATAAHVMQPPATAAHVMQPPATAAHAMQPPATAAHVMQPPATAAHVMQPPAMPATAVMEPAMPTTVAALAPAPSMPTVAQTVQPPATAVHVMQPPATAAHVIQPPAMPATGIQPTPMVAPLAAGPVAAPIPPAAAFPPAQQQQQHYESEEQITRQRIEAWRKDAASTAGTTPAADAMTPLAEQQQLTSAKDGFEVQQPPEDYPNRPSSPSTVSQIPSYRHDPRYNKTLPAAHHPPHPGAGYPPGAGAPGMYGAYGAAAAPGYGHHAMGYPMYPGGPPTAPMHHYPTMYNAYGHMYPGMHPAAQQHHHHHQQQQQQPAAHAPGNPGQASSVYGGNASAVGPADFQSQHQYYQQQPQHHHHQQQQQQHQAANHGGGSFAPGYGMNPAAQAANNGVFYGVGMYGPGYYDHSGQFYGYEDPTANQYQQQQQEPQQEQQLASQPQQAASEFDATVGSIGNLGAENTQYPVAESTRHLFPDGLMSSPPPVAEEITRTDPMDRFKTVCRPCVRFGFGGQLTVVRHDSLTARPHVCVMSVPATATRQEELEGFPGPLTHESTAASVAEFTSARASCCASEDRADEDIFWRILGVLAKEKESPVSDNMANSKVLKVLRAQSECKESPEPSRDYATAVSSIRQLLLDGDKEGAFDQAIYSGLWGHAFFLARYIPDGSERVARKFSESLSSSDVMHTLFQLMDKRTASGLAVCGEQPDMEWCNQLAVIIANFSIAARYKAVTELARSLESCGRVHAAHLCYLLAGEVPRSTGGRLHLLGANHRLRSSEFVTPLVLQATEVYEYSCLRATGRIHTFYQTYRLLYAHWLTDAHMTTQALDYCRSISKYVISKPQAFSASFSQHLTTLSTRLVHHCAKDLGSDTRMPAWLEKLSSAVPTTSHGDSGLAMATGRVSVMSGAVGSNGSACGSTASPAFRDTQHAQALMSGRTQQESDAGYTSSLAMHGSGTTADYSEAVQEPAYSTSLASQQNQAVSAFTDVGSSSNTTAHQYGGEDQPDWAQRDDQNDQNVAYATQQANSIAGSWQPTQEESTRHQQQQQQEQGQWQQHQQQQQEQGQWQQHQHQQQQWQHHQQQQQWPQQHTSDENAGSLDSADPGDDPFGVGQRAVDQGSSHPNHSTGWDQSNQQQTRAPVQEDSVEDESPPAAAENKSEPKKESKSGLFSFLGWGSKKNEGGAGPKNMILPDDKDPPLVYDEKKGMWIDKNEPDKLPPGAEPPPPDASFHQPGPTSSQMHPASSGPTPSSSASVPSEQSSKPGAAAGATAARPSKGRLANKYVDTFGSGSTQTDSAASIPPPALPALPPMGAAPTAAVFAPPMPAPGGAGSAENDSGNSLPVAAAAAPPATGAAGPGVFNPSNITGDSAAGQTKTFAEEQALWQQKREQHKREQMEKKRLRTERMKAQRQAHGGQGASGLEDGFANMQF